MFLFDTDFAASLPAQSNSVAQLQKVLLLWARAAGTAEVDQSFCFMPAPPDASHPAHSYQTALLLEVLLLWAPVNSRGGSTILILFLLLLLLLALLTLIQLLYCLKCFYFKDHWAAGAAEGEQVLRTDGASAPAAGRPHLPQTVL